MSKSNIKVNTSIKKEVTESVENQRLLNNKNLVILSIILVITLLVFWRTTRNGFTDWDDDVYVVKSDLIQHLNWSYFKTYFTTLTANLYTPLVTLSYAIDFKLFGMSAAGFHSTNLVLHGINCVLVFIFTFLLLKRSLVAGFTMLLFAIHPLNVETVAWISSRKDLLFTLFYLLGLITYLVYLDTNKKKYMILVFVLFILAVLSKPIAFTFPFVLLLIDFFKNNTLTKNKVLEKIPFLFITLVVGLFGIYLVQKFEVFATAPAGYNLFDKICLAGYSLAFYIYNAIIPTGISNYHAYPFKDGTFLDGKYVFSPLLVLLLLFVVYKSYRKNFILVMGFLFFLIIIGPTLRLIPTGYPINADRYFYLASIGFFWAIILTLEKIASQSFPLRYIVFAVSGILIIVYSVTSFRRVADWKDSYTLWNSALKKDNFHEVANDHLGKLYDNAGDKDRALIHFQRIIARDTTKSDILNSAGNILASKKQPDLALTYFTMAIATGNADQLPYYNRGMLYSDQNKFPKAISDFSKSISIKSDFAEAFNNRAIAKIKSGDTLGAYTDFKEAVRLKPTDAMMINNLERLKGLIKNPE